MAQKQKIRSNVEENPEGLLRRIQRARDEGKFKLGLELVRGLFHIQPTPANRELLKEMTLSRANQLSREGNLADSVTLLKNAESIDSTNPAWLDQLVEQLARNGGIQPAVALQERLHPGIVNPHILEHAADFGLIQPAEKILDLLGSWKSDHGRILQAFQQMQDKKDDESLETLQGIALRSPYLDWKLLIRGFLSYYKGEDLKALENWQRLNPNRIAYRMAAPFRIGIDPSYRESQAPETITILKKQRERLQGVSVLGEIRAIRQMLNEGESLRDVFREIKSFLPGFRFQYPDLVSRLANIIYWKILDTGPNDIPAYLRLFGPPVDDPELSRLSAIALERCLEWEEANLHWEKYQKSMVRWARNWSPQDMDRARALIWLRMGKNAADHSVPDQRKSSIPIRPFRLDSLSSHFEPSAEKCLQNALQLAPDLQEASIALLNHQRSLGKSSRAIQTARKLLQYHPGHTQTQLTLALLYMENDSLDNAQSILEEAIQTNPLHPELRNHLGKIHWLRAREQKDAGQLEDALKEFEIARNIGSFHRPGSLRIQMAACHLLAGNAERADDLLEQAKTESGTPIAVTFQFLMEIARTKMKTKKTALEKEWKAALQSPPVPEEALALLTVLYDDFKEENIRYTGQPSHSKKIYNYLSGARNQGRFHGKQYRLIVQYLFELKAPQLLQKQFLNDGLNDLESAPFCLYYQALGMRSKQTARRKNHIILGLLESASQKVQKLPEGPETTKLIHDIEELRKVISQSNPFHGFFDDFARSFGFDEDDL